MELTNRQWAQPPVVVTRRVTAIVLSAIVHSAMIVAAVAAVRIVNAQFVWQLDAAETNRDVLPMVAIVMPLIAAVQTTAGNRRQPNVARQLLKDAAMVVIPASG